MPDRFKDKKRFEHTQKAYFYHSQPKNTTIQVTLLKR